MPCVRSPPTLGQSAPVFFRILCVLTPCQVAQPVTTHFPCRVRMIGRRVELHENLPLNLGLPVPWAVGGKARG